MATIGKDIEKAVNLLKAGKPVAIPTETVYGLGANALDAIAVAWVFEIKNRPHFDPLIVHTYSIDKAIEYVTSFPEPLKNLAKIFWPGPLTLLLPKRAVIPDLVTSGLDRVAIRVPQHVLTRELLKQLDFPLAAPSANPFGYISPTTPEHVNKQLGNEIEYILDGGPCAVGLESTIVGMEGDKVCIYRLGGLDIENIIGIVGPVELRIEHTDNPNSAGQLKNHYAPKKPFYIGNLEELAKKYSDKKLGVLSFGKHPTVLNSHMNINLSANENLTEAAANLFSDMRALDDSEAEIIICDLVPPKGLGLAINDRLKRASS